MEEEWNSISTSTNSMHSIEIHPSRDEIDAFSQRAENLQSQLNSLTTKIQDIENRFSKDRKSEINDKSKDITCIRDQIPLCTELYQCLQNTVKELGEQKFILDSQFKGLTLNLNNNNIRLLAVENDVKTITLKYNSLFQMYETLQGQLEIVAGKIYVKFDYLEQMLSYTTREYYRTSDTLEDL
ncbi:PREDICTED: uncharacterized protein LOC107161603 isoform X2 [Diuraphis noxia]|nr:PREDICTED: uncharacterized protein LOC107161603 isoform X2 [Diuraphis noxia]